MQNYSLHVIEDTFLWKIGKFNVRSLRLSIILTSVINVSVRKISYLKEFFNVVQDVFGNISTFFNAKASLLSKYVFPSTMTELLTEFDDE